MPPRLPATAEAFAAGAASLRHVEVVAKVLGTDAANRLAPQDRATPGRSPRRRLFVRARPRVLGAGACLRRAPPHLNVLVRLEDLENRARAGCLDFGGARCGRPPSWCEVHHIQAWQDGGPTCLTNCLMLCKACHRLIHHAGWDVALVDGWPEFYPPTWIDPSRRPRRRPRPVAAG